MALGIWWLYLLVKMGQLDPDALKTNVVNLAMWEGGTFIVLLVTLTMSFLTLYFREIRQTKSLQNFFSALTHELKTPLASIRLQSEVLAESLEKNNPEAKEITFAERLIEDTQNLETQMDKIIQLSRITRRGQLTLRPISLKDIIKNVVKNYAGSIDIEVNGLSDTKVLGDQFAIELILKNLIENTKHHSGSETASININNSSPHQTKVIYQDQGNFSGDNKKLGKLFYTNHASRGSGIGLFLIQKLMLAMKGSTKIEPMKNFTVTLTFNNQEES